MTKTKTTKNKTVKKKGGRPKGSKQVGGNNKKRITKALIKKAIEGTGGIKTAIAKKAGICRLSLYKSLKEWPELEALIQDESEMIKDVAEAEIIRQIRGGNTAVLIFFAKCRMRDRGYIEKQEIDMKIKEMPGLKINMEK